MICYSCGRPQEFSTEICSDCADRRRSELASRQLLPAGGTSCSAAYEAVPVLSDMDPTPKTYRRGVEYRKLKEARPIRRKPLPE